MTRSKAVKAINNKICNSAPGLYSDEYWNGFNRVHLALKEVTHELNVSCNLNNSKYEQDETDKMPSRKKWVFLVEGYRWKEPIVVVVIASGAGTISAPLDRYDIVTYAS